MEINRIYLSLAHMGGLEQSFIQQAFDFLQSYIT
jgi:hypothetical protein